jgi:NADH-quinone oxidoreductase subunit L
VYVGPKQFVPGDDAELVDLGRHPKGVSLDAWHKEHGHGHGHGHEHEHNDHAHRHGSYGGVGDARAHGRQDFDPSTEEFDPHPPGFAMKFAIAACAILTIAAAGLYFVSPAIGEGGGWAAGMVRQSSAVVSAEVLSGHTSGTDEGHAHGTFLGMDPHHVMYYVSAGVGFIGVLIAAFLHGPKGWQGLFLGVRQSCDVAPRADKLANAFGPLTTAARNKYYVDEIYDALITRPLWVLSHIFHLFDQYVVDGLVNLIGALPRFFGKALRPIQSGEMHGYAVGMAGGVAVLLILVVLLVG